MTLALDDPRHGTRNGYVNYGCRCEGCLEAGRAYMRKGTRFYETQTAWRRARGVKPLDVHRAEIEPKHGTESRYTKYRCRCDECREASRKARAARRQKCS